LDPPSTPALRVYGFGKKLYPARPTPIKMSLWSIRKGLEAWMKMLITIHAFFSFPCFL